jgi:hypothetical protein
VLVGLDLVEKVREDEHHHSHLQGEQTGLSRCLLASASLYATSTCKKLAKMIPNAK